MLDYQPVMDVTPVNNSAYFQEYRDKGGRTPFLEGDTVEISPTGMSSGPVVSLTRAANQTLTFSELNQKSADGIVAVAEPAESGAIAAARDARLALLAQKYEGTATREDTARLNILTHRLRRLSPRVTEEDINALTQMVDEVEQVSASLNELRNLLGV